jgi:hypothetical protein
MVSRLITYWRNTDDMPAFVRLLCKGGMVAGPFLLVALFIPDGDRRVNDEVMSYSEFWASGAGASALLFVGLVTAGSWGMAARAHWSRWALVLAQLIPLVPFPKLLLPSLPLSITLCAISAAIVYLCLFHIPSIRAYMEATKT